MSALTGTFGMTAAPPEGLLASQALIDSAESTIKARFAGDPEEAQKRINLFWNTLVELHGHIAPKREALLEQRAEKQAALDKWLQENPEHSPAELKQALIEIGYHPEKELAPAEYEATTENMSPEITTAAPQLVVPADKASMVLNAMNARWGSLTEAAKAYPDILEGEQTPEGFVNVEMERVFNFKGTIFSNVAGFKTSGETLVAFDNYGNEFEFEPTENQKFVGYGLDDDGNVNSVLLENNGLKVEITVDGDGKRQDVLMESAATVIVDKEDSTVSAPEIKEQAEKNIAQLMDGTLEVELSRGRGIRKLAANTKYLDPKGGEHELARTAQLLVRSVSDHMKLPASAVTINDGQVSEKTWDLLMNAVMGVEYHVLPKMRNEKEVALAMEELGRIEKALGIEQGHLKVGIMNEEFEMNLRLREALAVARDRVFFVNSGFLDKFGSDMEALMNTGPVDSYNKLTTIRIKTEYEKNNVAVSLAARVAQVGAGMWAKIKDAVGHKGSKIQQINDGNDVSWDPNPIMAVLHALHYHGQRPLAEIQQAMRDNPAPIDQDALFEFPRGNFTDPSREDYIPQEQIASDLRDATYGLVGYAGPWVDAGTGCSAIADSKDDLLMEDRATGRIKAAFLRNWLLHGVVTEEQVIDSIISVSDEIGVSEHVVKAVGELVFNPENRGDALVDTAFMKGYQRAHGQDEEETVPLTPTEEQRRAQGHNRQVPPAITAWQPIAAP